MRDNRPNIPKRPKRRKKLAHDFRLQFLDDVGVWQEFVGGDGSEASARERLDVVRKHATGKARWRIVETVKHVVYDTGDESK